MNSSIFVSVIIGIVFLIGIVVLFFNRDKNEDDAHVRVGKEWMTIAEYKKRYLTKP